MNERLTSGFTQAGVYARRQFCADLEVCRPPEPLWNPRLREAATTLAASVGGQLGCHLTFILATTWLWQDLRSL